MSKHYVKTVAGKIKRNCYGTVLNQAPLNIACYNIAVMTIVIDRVLTVKGR